jgi:CRP/FNR family transcriptional regulator, cyclic AMP receptor protein
VQHISLLLLDCTEFSIIVRTVRGLKWSMDKRNPGKDQLDRSFEGPYFVDNLSAHGPELSALLQDSKVCKYAAGEVIYLHGEEGTQFYYIQSGGVKIGITNRDGYEKILAICGSQTFIGEHIMDYQTYGATATALEDSELYAIDGRRFESLVIENPAIGLMMLKCVRRKVTVLAHQIADLRFLTAQGKIARALLEMSDRPGQKTLNGATVPEKITHETLANLTGLSRPTVTIILNELEKQNVLRKHRASLVIVEREKLERILASELL